MKRFFVLFILSIFVSSLIAQNNDYVHINMNNNQTHVIKQMDIDSILCTKHNWLGEKSLLWKAQTIYTKNREFIIPFKDLESVKFNMPYKEQDIIYYCICPLEKEYGWDSIMIATNGCYFVSRTNDDGTTTLLIDSVGANNNQNTIVMQISQDMTPISLYYNNMLFYFIDYGNGLMDVHKMDNGQLTVYEKVGFKKANYVKRRAGVSETHYWKWINLCASIGSVLTAEGISNKLASFFSYVVDKTSDELNFCPDISYVLSYVGLTIGTGLAIVSGVVTVPYALGAFVIGAVSSYFNQWEENENEWKKIWYFGEAGLAEIETLSPVYIHDNTYRLSVRVSNTSTLPSLEKKNTFGILLEKEYDGVEAVNLYSKGAQICMERELSEDGVFDVDINNIEPGYKYFCRAFLLTATEKELRNKGKIGHASSYAYYGDIEEFKLDGPKRKLNYNLVSADNKDEDKVHFKMDVEVDIIDFSEDMEKYGVRLYKDDVKYDLSSEIEILYLRSGPPSSNPVWNEGYRKVEIEFDANRDALTINKDMLQATTKDHWRIETYVQYGRGENAIESKSSQPLDLVYNEAPKAKTLDMTTATQPTSAVVECEYHNYGIWGGQCGVEYWKEDEQHLEKYIDIPKDGSLSIELTDLDPFTSYEYRAFIKVNDTYYYAKETKDFVTQFCKPRLVDYEVLEATFDPNNYHNGEETYSFRFHIATTWEIESLKKIVDWGYKYIDLNNKTERISLMEFGNSYKDCRFAFYRNSRDSEILFIPYVKYGNKNANNRSNTKRASEEDEDGIIYGDTIRIRLLYDKRPEVTTLEAINITANSANLTGKVDGYDATDESIKFAFIYSTNSDILDSTDGKTVPAAYDGNGNLTANITGLTDYTTYYYAVAYRFGDADFVIGEVKSFKTLPKVTTIEDPFVTICSATLQGKCSKGVTVAGFYVKRSDESFYKFKYNAIPDENGNFSAIIDTIDTVTLYDYCAFVQVNEQIIKGMEYSFITKTLCPDDNHPHTIDLDLPSGTKWACCNVGASKPEDVGGYYAWGETSEKVVYSYENHILFEGYKESLLDGESYPFYRNVGNITASQYDAAFVNWGARWQTPTVTQFQEIINNCSYKHFKYNRKRGLLFTSPNGNYLFLPTGGLKYMQDDMSSPYSNFCTYWTSNSASNYFNQDAFSFYWYGLDNNPLILRRMIMQGINVRPVTR